MIFDPNMGNWHVKEVTFKKKYPKLPLPLNGQAVQRSPIIDKPKHKSYRPFLFPLF
jgi:hypothetical protein